MRKGVVYPVNCRSMPLVLLLGVLLGNGNLLRASVKVTMRNEMPKVFAQ